MPALPSFRAAALLGRLPPDLAGLHLVFVTPDGLATFARGNAGHLAAWWARQCAKLDHPEHWVVMHRREIATVADAATGLPVNRRSSCWFRHGMAHPLTAEKARDGFALDTRIGAFRPATCREVFVDFG